MDSDGWLLIIDFGDDVFLGRPVKGFHDSQAIQVECKHFACGHLYALVNCKGLEPVACVDINIEGAREGLHSLFAGY